MATLVAKKAVDTSTLSEFSLFFSHGAQGGVDLQNTSEVKVHASNATIHAAFDFKSVGHDFTYDPVDNTPHGTIGSIGVSSDNVLAYTIADLSNSFDQFLADLHTSVATMIAGVFNGKDTITGSKFDDTLDGFDGKDSLKGGKGKDLFLFNTAFGKNNVDTIKDFDHKDDTIGIDHLLVGALAGDKVKSSSFHVGSDAADKGDRFIYDDGSGKLYFDADGKGHQDQVLVAILKDHPTINAHDLIIA